MAKDWKANVIKERDKASRDIGNKSVKFADNVGIFYSLCKCLGQKGLERARERSVGFLYTITITLSLLA